MALKAATTNCEYIKWGQVEEGATITGFYMETKPSVKFPNQLNHYIETVEGKRYGLNGSGSLDKAFEQIRQGWYVEIAYEGMFTLESGNFKGTEYHRFKVQYDDERIHPFFSGDASARKEVEYKRDEQTTAPPVLVKPESIHVQSTPVPMASGPVPTAASATGGQPAAVTPKRSIF
jgi:hypothetical protein